MNRLERVLPFLFLFVLGLALTDAAADEERDRVKIKWPSPEFRDLQSAIDAADDAIIEIKEGVYQIDRPLFVRGKRLVIAGAGSGRKPEKPFTHLVGRPPFPVLDDRGNLVLRAEAVEGLWNFIAADVMIKDMWLTGFDAAIVSKPDDRGNSGPTEVKDVMITDTGRGILSLSSSDLSVKNSTIMNTLWNGISFAPKLLNPDNLPTFTAKSNMLLNPGGAGYYFEDSVVFIDDETEFGAAAGGIVGLSSTSFITNSFLVGNKEAGILLVGGFSEIENNTILGTKVGLDNILGDGISLWSRSTPQQVMKASVSDNFISGSDRFGISVYGAAADLADNGIFCSGFIGFDLFGADHAMIPFELNDLGGNQCGGCGTTPDCEATGEGLTPPPPIGGLE